jgi:hypothetical protein
MEQAAYGIDNLESYVLTHDSFFLSRARAQANRLIATRAAVGSAWFFPYRWDFAVHGTELLRAPWYSAMAQGLALTLFTRLHENTKVAVYRTGAYASYLSMTASRSGTRPWVSFVDASGYLWLEEYADYAPVSYSDRTVNGHLFALNGVWDYWRFTQDASVAATFDGAATTMRAYADSTRTARWVSKYCLRHGVRSVGYHYLVMSLWQTLFGLTANTHFAQVVDALTVDYPFATLSRTIRLAPGTYTLYHFGDGGGILSSHVIAFPRGSSAPGDRRQRIYGREIYYRISGGGLSQWWIREQPDQVVMVGTWFHRGYVHARPVTLPAGSITGYVFDSAGNVTSRTSRTFAAVTQLHTLRSAYYNARLYYRISDGDLAGHWVRASAVSVT